MTKQHACRCVKITLLKVLMQNVSRLQNFCSKTKFWTTRNYFFPSGKSDGMKSNMNVRRKMELRKMWEKN